MESLSGFVCDSSTEMSRNRANPAVSATAKIAASVAANIKRLSDWQLQKLRTYNLATQWHPNNPFIWRR